MTGERVLCFLIIGNRVYIYPHNELRILLGFSQCLDLSLLVEQGRSIFQVGEELRQNNGIGEGIRIRSSSGGSRRPRALARSSSDQLRKRSLQHKVIL